MRAIGTPFFATRVGTVASSSLTLAAVPALPYPINSLFVDARIPSPNPRTVRSESEAAFARYDPGRRVA